MQSSPELLVQPHLARGERLLWSGRPDRGVRFQRSDLIPSLFGMFGAAVMGSGIVKDILDGDYGNLVFLIPFGTVWVGFMAGQPFFRAWRRRNVTYGLTERRALILYGSAPDIQSVTLQGESTITVLSHRDGTGTILLGNAGPAFQRIWNANEVFRLIQDIQSRPHSE